MTCLRSPVILVIVLGYALTAATASSAQAVEYSCKYLFSNVHQATDCLEALFSEDIPYVHGHLTMGSGPARQWLRSGCSDRETDALRFSLCSLVPPAMRDGKVFASPADPDTKEKVDQGGYKSLLVPKFCAAVSTNGSWIVSGSADWLPGIYKPGLRLESPP